MKKSELIHQHESRLSHMLLDMKVEVENIRANRMKEIESEAYWKEFDEKRRVMHMLLEEQRAEKLYKEALLAKQREETEIEKQEKQEILLKAAELYAQEMKAKVLEYKTKKEEEARLQQQELTAAEQARKEKILLEIEQNKDKVAQRAVMLFEKEQQRKLYEVIYIHICVFICVYITCVIIDEY